MTISCKRLENDFEEINAYSARRGEPVTVDDDFGNEMVLMPVDMYDDLTLRVRLLKNAYLDEKSGVFYTADEVRAMLNLPADDGKRGRKK